MPLSRTQRLTPQGRATSVDCIAQRDERGDRAELHAAEMRAPVVVSHNPYSARTHSPSLNRSAIARRYIDQPASKLTRASEVCRRSIDLRTNPRRVTSRRMMRFEQSSGSSRLRSSHGRSTANRAFSLIVTLIIACDRYSSRPDVAPGAASSTFLAGI